jgi:hydrogenase maturation protease
MTASSDTLILGWGNPGRLDDGLGPALVAALENSTTPGVAVDSEYQLQIENAETVARHRRVVFVDADRQGDEPFSLRRLHPSKCAPSFSTHSLSPRSVLALSRDLFDAEPEAWLMGIRGYQFNDFGEELSEQAKENLTAAIRFLLAALRAENLQEIRPTRADGESPRESRG